MIRQTAHPRRLRALWSLPLLVGVAAGASGPPSAVQAGSATGSIEVCKSSNNGMAGKPFSFSIDGGSSFAVVGGGCSQVFTVATGNHTVNEAPGGFTLLTKITASPSGSLKSASLATGDATVSVAASVKTLVTYTNTTPIVQVSVCKQAAAGATKLQGEPFSFTMTGQPNAFTVNAGPFGAPNCSALFNYPAGTNITVTELQPPPNVFVSSIDVSSPPASNISTDLKARTASFTTRFVTEEANTVIYTDDVAVPAPPGFIRICKSAGDQFVSATFAYSILDSAGVTHGPIQLAVSPATSPACSDPIQVSSGPALITEARQSPYFLSSVSVVPADRLIDDNLTEQTVDVSVVTGDQTTETLVAFTDATSDGMGSACKTLSPGSDALVGTSFDFPWSGTFKAPDGTTFPFSGTASIVAPSPGQSACDVLKGPLAGAGFPQGSLLNVTETALPNAGLIQVNVSPNSNDLGSSPSSGANLAISSGITIATFTNAFSDASAGALKICKVAADSETQNAGAVTLVINDSSFSATVTVNPGHCALPISVPAGAATIQEQRKTNFHLVSVTATGPDGSSRLQTGTTANPATVSVPLGGVANVTTVTFTNAVNTGLYKLCKTSSNAALAHTTFTFGSYYTVNGKNLGTSTDRLIPGQCSGVHGPIPLVNDDQSPVTVTTTESGSSDVYVNSIRYQGNGHQNSTGPTGQSAVDQGSGESFSIGQGQNVVTYDNEVYLDGA